MAKIDREEYEILKELHGEDFKWIVRDSDGDLYAATVALYKSIRDWLGVHGSGARFQLLNFVGKTVFQFIQWEDEEPHNIAELIEEYEDSKEYKDSLVIEYFMDKAKESEETEVKKDIEWLKEEVENMPYTRLERVGMEDYVSISKSGVLEKIDQVDKPELPVVPNEVEEEQKYVLLINITDKASKTNYETYLNKKGIFHSMENESFNKEDFNWSEEEIKDLENGEILFEHFAVKVEEMEQ